MSKATALVLCMVGFVAVLAGVVVLTLAGKDTSIFIGFATSAAVFLVPQLLNLLKSHDTNNAVENQQKDVAEIKERTNGPLTIMQQQVNTLVHDFEEHIKKGGDNAGSP